VSSHPPLLTDCAESSESGTDASISSRGTEPRYAVLEDV